MRLLLVAALGLVGCKSAADKACGAMVELAERCLPDPPAALTDSMQQTCVVALTQDRGDGKNLAADLARAFEDCTRATTCDELTACFARNGCQAQMESATAAPQFACWPRPR